MEPVGKKRRATYEDVIHAPEHMVAEIIDGDLELSPRPGALATSVASVLTGELEPPFRRGKGGPGGWFIFVEPELHVGDGDVLVPDLAGWRRERMNVVPDSAAFEIAPDWVCEVLSRSTEKRDRIQKLRIYARWGVQHAWLVHPHRRTLEAFRLHEGKWLLVATHADDARARIEPFDAIELDLANLWADLPFRAGEETAEYVTAQPAP